MVEIGKADRLECEAWNAIIWAGGPAMPQPAKLIEIADSVEAVQDGRIQLDGPMLFEHKALGSSLRSNAAGSRSTGPGLT
jgi:hypothetical protein